MAEKQTKKRIFLTLAEKMIIAEKLEEGALVKTLCEEYGVSEGAIRRIRRESSLLMKFGNRGNHVLQHKNRRKSSYEDLENRLYSWFLEQRAMKNHLTDALLREKARELIKELGPTSFTASRGWLWNFKNRYGIRLITADEEGSADEGAQIFVINFDKQENVTESEEEKEEKEVDQPINNLETDVIEKKRDLVAFENIVKKYANENQEWLMVATALKQFLEKQPPQVAESNSS